MKVLFFTLAITSLMSCAKLETTLDKANSIPGKMDDLAAKTDELKRLTILGQMKAQLEDNKNYDILSPVPFKLMAAAKLAAENFTVDELLQWTYNGLKQINDARYDDNNHGKPIEDTNPDAVKFEDDKLGYISAMEAVSGFLPDSMIDQMVAKVYTSEEYTQTILHIFAMRNYFIQNVLMNEVYPTSELTDIGTIESAIKYNQSLEKILRLPFADYIKTDIHGFNLAKDYNQALTFGLDKTAAVENWKNIARGLDKKLQVTQFSSDLQSERVNSARALVSQGLKSWGVNPASLK